VAFLRPSPLLINLVLEGEEHICVPVVAPAKEEPIRWLATNAGCEGSIVVQRSKALSGNHGFNAQTEQYEDLVAAGVLDPAKVVRSALQNAASIASLLLTTEAVVSQIGDDAPGQRS
jgi:chaperonin GroEL